MLLKKYVIYETETGKTAMLYVETIEEFKKLYPEKEAEKYTFPMVVNLMGKKKVFDINDPKFFGILKTNKKPLTLEEQYPKNSKNFKLGWITPEGDTYSVPFEDHTLSAEVICRELGLADKNFENTLELLGWAKVTKVFEDGKYSKGVLLHKDKKLTNKQMGKIFDFELYNNVRTKKLIDRSI